MTGLEDSPIFDGSETSLSGNGKFIANRSDIVLGLSLGLPPIYLPTGTGGGCVTSGPFVNMSVNLGPSALDEPGGVSASNPNGPLSYNPRCLKRDLTDYVVQNFANATAVLSNILDYDNIYDFEYAMQGVPGSGSLGIHGGGHYAMGGDPGRGTFLKLTSSRPFTDKGFRCFRVAWRPSVLSSSWHDRQSLVAVANAKPSRAAVRGNSSHGHPNLYEFPRKL